MKKNILRTLAMIMAVIDGIIFYIFCNAPTDSDGKFTGMVISVLCCIIFFHYAITGYRRPFFTIFGWLLPNNNCK
jgi:hypothetical protein